MFKMIRDNPDELAHAVQWTPYSREEYYTAYESSKELDEMERAGLFLVWCWMARSGKTSARTGWKQQYLYLEVRIIECQTNGLRFPVDPTEKPIDMMKLIIENSSEEGGGGDREWSGALNCSYSKSAMGYF
ncbi:hypothetical protein [Paenibacillus sp. FSL R7-0337]|uniref:hypothetical protein n=1 Tax=Paenibacillus sp. FSL R7-0337 TaxID=1926588 RepID=UPI00096F66FC|nr:hypothetical protein [Paenibacillus sp. FSL R7-0337]OMG00448.1 hypothetical protein BK147_04410 [Paenibacillus sp. FSL R7-0337]